MSEFKLNTKQDTMSSTSSTLMNLPILKHFNETEINKQVDSFRKGEKGIFWFLKLAVLIGVGYLTWEYVLPPLFQAIGQFVAVAATGVLIVAGIIMAPVIVKGLRKLTRSIHKSIIRHDPFGELETQRASMIQNQLKFREAKGKISGLKNDMEIEADRSEKESKSQQNKILSLQQAATKLKTSIDDMVKTYGIKAKESDEYVNATAELQKKLSESQRISYQLTQSKDLVQKYGSRAAIMKKVGQKLTMVETSMGIKIDDFDATIEILKKDYAFAQKSRQATESAKDAMMFSKSWELDYALDVVTSTIASDIAITAGNFKDIDSLTATYGADSDELYNNLNLLADNIKVGKDEIPSAKAYNNPEYQLSGSDKLKSGGFDELF